MFALFSNAMLTYTHRCTEKRKKKGVLCSLRGRDLETATVIGRKTMKHFSSSSEEALPGSGSMTSLYPAVLAARGGSDGGRCVCVCLCVCERKCTVGLGWCHLARLSVRISFFER